MGLYLGDKGIKEIYLGNKKVSRIYLGNTLVFGSESTPSSKFKNATHWVKGVTNIPMPVDKKHWGIAEIQRFTVTGEPANSERLGLEWNADMGWYDCTKMQPEENPSEGEINRDSNLCWAATCSNMIHWWLDANKENIIRYNKYKGPSKYTDALHSEVWDYFKYRFTNYGSTVQNGLKWFFLNQYSPVPEGAERIEKNVYEDGRPKHTGFFTEIFKDKNLSELASVCGPSSFNDELKLAFERGDSMGLSVEVKHGQGGHAITIWGAHFNEHEEVDVLYICENNDKFNLTQGISPMQPGKLCNNGIYEHKVKQINGIWTLEAGAYEKYTIPILNCVFLHNHHKLWEEYFKDHKPDVPESDFKNATHWVSGLHDIPMPVESTWGIAFPEGPSNSKRMGLEWKDGMGWYDCTKIISELGHENEPNNRDSNLCWAATTANMMYWWLDKNQKNIEKYAKYNGPSKYKGNPLSNEIWDYFKYRWTNKGLTIQQGLNWLFFDKYTSLGEDGAQEIVKDSYEDNFPKHKGFFKDVLKDLSLSDITSNCSGYSFNEELKEGFKRGDAMGLTITTKGGASGHAITIWGAHFNEKEEVDILYVCENNDNYLLEQGISPMQAGKLCPCGIYEHKVKRLEDGTWALESSTKDVYKSPIISCTFLHDCKEYWEKYFNK